MTEHEHPDDGAPRAILTREAPGHGVYDIVHHGQQVVTGVELAGPYEPGDWVLYCREIVRGKYELGWERQ